MDIVLITSICLIVLLMIKMQIAYRAGIKALDKIFDCDNCMYLLSKYSPSRNFGKNVFHPLKWTYSQMFRGLDDE